MSEFSVFTLPNGIKCVHRLTKSPVAYLGITVGAGTRDEEESEQGVAHMVEHLLFKGTEHRSAYHINSRLDSVGGDLNAFTTKEETVVHATCLRRDYARAMELLADMVFHSVFPDREIEKERGVIIDEINSYKDSPADIIFDDFESLFFAGSPLGRDILGSKKTVGKATRGQILEYMARSYNTDRMVFSSCSSISHQRFRLLCERYLGGIPANPRTYGRVAPERQPLFRKEKVKKTYQTHCVMGGYGYDLTDDRRIVLSFLINILGGSSALSRLNMALRERHAVTYNIEAAYTPYGDSGIYTIYFGCEAEKYDRAREMVMKELALLRDKSLSPVQLARVKRQFIGQLALASDNDENLMLGIAKSLLVYGNFDSTAEIARKIESVGSPALLDVAGEVFAESNVNILTYR